MIYIVGVRSVFFFHDGSECSSCAAEFVTEGGEHASPHVFEGCCPRVSSFFFFV